MTRIDVLLVGAEEDPLHPRFKAVKAARFIPIERATPSDIRKAKVAFVWSGASGSMEAIWASAPRLQWVHTASIGVDHLVSELRGRNIVLTNTVGVFEGPVAEYVLSLILVAAKGILETASAQRDHRWHYRAVDALAGASLLVVGFGRIGRRVVHLANAVGLRTAIVTGGGSMTGSVRGDLVRSRADLDSALGVADYVVLSVPLTDRTRGMIGASEFEMMKVGSVLINVSRGAVVDMQALVANLANGHLAAAMLDVFPSEPLLSDDPIWDVPNLFISPHMAGDTIGWDDRVISGFASNLRRFQQGERLADEIDLERGY